MRAANPGLQECYDLAMAPAESTLKSLVELRQVSKSYPGERGNRVTVVNSVTLSMSRGETLGLVGESGSGKSTVARMLLGLIQPDSGEVIFDGIPIFNGTRAASASSMRRIRRRMQPVFQDPFAALNPRMRVAEIVTEPLKIFSKDEGIDATRAGLPPAILRAHEGCRPGGIGPRTLPA